MGKTQLAQLYFPMSSPEQACRNFNRMVARAKGLMPALERLGYALHSNRAEGVRQTRLLTAAMVRIIVQY